MNIHKAPNAPQVSVDMYFGGNIPAGTLSKEGDVISQAEFNEFLVEEVTPTFPGFTLATNKGYWKGQPETVRVLTILTADSDSLRNTIRMIAERYKTRFTQEAVAYSFTACEFTLDCWPYGPVKAYHRDGKGY
jgi:hypothetical protein